MRSDRLVMFVRWFLIGVLAGIALVSALAHSGSILTNDCATNWMDCTADSPIEINSFSMIAAGVASAIIVSAQTATRELRQHKITRAQATAILNKDRYAKSLWDQARQLCQADTAGNCTQNSTQAFALLTQAQKAIP